jgi:hypothetical protein
MKIERNISSDFLKAVYFTGTYIYIVTKRLSVPDLQLLIEMTLGVHVCTVHQ